MRFVIILAMMLLMGAGCVSKQVETSETPPLNLPLEEGEKKAFSPPAPARGGQARRDKGEVGEEGWERTDFSQFNPIFRFSAELSNTWQVEYVREIEALNVYGPAQAAMPARELSQIFIRYFEASDFLTLRTVDILKRQETKINGHDAVEYEIAKKSGVPNFPHQPSWRNGKHQVTDIRFTKNNPSMFYVFARNPTLSDEMWEKFLRSVQFHNDVTGFSAPLDRVKERVTKKPFGLQVSPENSPVDPERFSGYHTGVDFETFDDENDAPPLTPPRTLLRGGETEQFPPLIEGRLGGVGAEKTVTVRAFCGGPIREKRTADGYGGVVVQECLLGDQAVTVVYGHLKIDPHLISPLTKGEKEGVGDYLAPGDPLSTLGAAFSAETDGERKHLHFGIHKGSRIDIRGYVASEGELSNWFDPRGYLK